MDRRQYILTEDPALKLNEKEHGEFLFLLETAILDSLERRELLTHVQKAQCTAELEKRFRRTGQQTIWE